MKRWTLKSGWLAISIFIICFLLLLRFSFLQSLDRVVIYEILPLFPSLTIQSLTRPDWAGSCEILAFTVVILFLLYRSTLTHSNKPLLFILLLVLLIGIELLLLIHLGIWLRLILPVLLLLTGSALLAGRDFLSTTSANHPIETRIAEKNYTTGLAFQQQGQLDWAFDKFKACPPNPSLMKALFKLAKEYESKQHFKKAIAVYEHMEKFDKDFRDINNRKKNAEQQITSLSDVTQKTIRTGKGLLPNSVFSHYRIEKEIGKGATGTVYLGLDLRTDQQVAIKTLPLADEFDESEIESVKQRFFREAETAGQLNHPNIVRIYDAGESDGLAFIAMAFLSGHDLTRYTRKDNLLSPLMVMGIVHKAARAMHYAHSKQVIHRDIKPANIMFDPENKKIILTDFGIARLIDASRTRTGIILGTPAYMSPEQLEGQKIDGRSDLFALGVMLFQLLTGELPFKGESLAMLMYMISNEPHRDILKLRPDLAQSYPYLAAIIDTALEKDAADRYQSGYEMAEAIKQCAKI